MNGQLKSRTSMLNGRQHGLVELLYDGGQEMGALYYDNGRLHGIQCVWDQDGTLVFAAEFKRGEPHKLIQGSAASIAAFKSKISAMLTVAAL